MVSVGTDILVAQNTHDGQSMSMCYIDLVGMTYQLRRCIRPRVSQSDHQDSFAFELGRAEAELVLIHWPRSGNR